MLRELVADIEQLGKGGRKGGGRARACRSVDGGANGNGRGHRGGALLWLSGSTCVQEPTKTVSSVVRNAWSKRFQSFSPQI